MRRKKKETLQCATVKNPRVLEFFNIYIYISEKNYPAYHNTNSYICDDFSFI